MNQSPQEPVPEAPHETARELLGAYACDALEDAERSTIERHLGRCRTCLAEVAHFHEVLAVLAATVATAPPPGLKDAIRSLVRFPPQRGGGRTA